MNKDRINKAIENLKKIIDEEGINPRKGLTEELFAFATSLIPCSNIDLLIRYDNNRVLLTWRNDKYYSEGWHIPGGCLRMHETLMDRVQKTAVKEIGTKVILKSNEFVTQEGIIHYNRPWLDNELERSHNISMLFDCKLPDDFLISNQKENEHAEGFLKWFDFYPDDLLQAHKELYGDILKEILEKKN